MFIKVDPIEFMNVVRPALEAGEVSRLARCVGRRWASSDLCPLLKHEDVDVRRVTALTLGLVGDLSCVGCLTHALHDEDEQVNEMAEHGLWSIWFRAGKPEAAAPFRQGVTLLSSESYHRAIDCFRRAVEIDPTFAEAHNQCALAHFFIGRWEPAIEQCKQTLALMPAHFGAISGMGHCYTQLGRMSEALSCYRQALAINPRMTAVVRAAERIEEKIGGRSGKEDQGSTPALAETFEAAASRW